MRYLSDRSLHVTTFCRLSAVTSQDIVLLLLLYPLNSILSNLVHFRQYILYALLAFLSLVLQCHEMFEFSCTYIDTSSLAGLEDLLCFFFWI